MCAWLRPQTIPEWALDKVMTQRLPQPGRAQPVKAQAVEIILKTTGEGQRGNQGLEALSD